LAAIDQAAAGQGAQIAMSLLQQGINESNLASNIYGKLLTTSIAQDTQLQNAVTSFAGSLVPKTGATINLTAANS